jgi:hypothetical protein
MGRTIPVQFRALVIAEDKVAYQHVNRADCQPGRRFAAVLTRNDFVTEIREDSGEKFGDLFIRFGQQNARHMLL